jgi:hypothetical protein
LLGIYRAISIYPVVDVELRDFKVEATELHHRFSMGRLER